MFKRQLLLVFLLCLSVLGCNSPALTSDTVPVAKIDEIKQRISHLYPNKDDELRHHILDVAVKAIDHLAFVEGGSFIMGDFGMPCDFMNRYTVEWIEGQSECSTSATVHKYGWYFQHPVTLGSYSMSTFETTYYDVDAFRLAHGLLVFEAKEREKYPKWASKIPSWPSPTKDWQEAKDYCQWLGEVTKLPFDLPTEAQWEYAARNRGQNIYYATNNGKLITDQNYRAAGSYDEYGRAQDIYAIQYDKSEWNYAPPMKSIHAVGIYPPNPLGLYDMAGNADEWVNDWYAKDYYRVSPEHNPQGPESGTDKVTRGFYTTMRVPEPAINEKSSSGRGFRCSLQQKTPAY